jgi:CheY-like chemotaxis protein
MGRPPARSSNGNAHAGARIWLIAPDWRLRALLRAQLLEEGYQVTALADWESLEALCRDEVVAPQLLVAELTGEEPAAVLSLLRQFPARRLVLRGAGAPGADELRAAGIDAVLSRPCTVEDGVTAVRTVLPEGG